MTREERMRERPEEGSRKIGDTHRGSRDRIGGWPLDHLSAWTRTTRTERMKQSRKKLFSAVF